MAGDLVHEGGASIAAQRLADLPHDRFVQVTQQAADWLDRAGDEGLALWARDLRDFLAQGATRAAITALPPKAPCGGSHGRGPAVRQAPELLTAMRRQLELNGHSNAEAARLLREFLSAYWNGYVFSKCRKLGIYPDPSSPHYHAHYLITTGAAIHANDLIGEERIARHLSRVRENAE